MLRTRITIIRTKGQCHFHWPPLLMKSYNGRRHLIINFVKRPLPSLPSFIFNNCCFEAAFCMLIDKLTFIENSKVTSVPRCDKINERTMNVHFHFNIYLCYRLHTNVQCRPLFASSVDGTVEGEKWVPAQRNLCNQFSRQCGPLPRRLPAEQRKVSLC